MAVGTTRWRSRISLRRVKVGFFSLCCLLFLCCGCERSREMPAATASQVQTTSRAESLGPRLTMEELHGLGGVPVGWQLTPPVGDPQRGREYFIEFGCHRCHAVAGENFPQGQSGPGPELTGMGAHHPPAYFVEAILNPNAVRVDGPDYLAPDGSSRMPAYPEMTLAELSDVVAYLSSLRTAAEDTSHAGHHSEGSHADHAAHHHHTQGTGVGPAGSAPVAAAFAQDRSAYVVRAYQLGETELEPFYDWFAEKRLVDVPGLLGIETYASRERTGAGKITLVTVFRFADEGAAMAFLDRASQSTEFFSPPGEVLLFGPVLFHALQLSLP